jgi:hypothetical protein
MESLAKPSSKPISTLPVPDYSTDERADEFPKPVLAKMLT